MKKIFTFGISRKVCILFITSVLLLLACIVGAGLSNRQRGDKTRQWEQEQPGQNEPGQSQESDI